MNVNIGPHPSDIIPVRRWEIQYTLKRHKTYHRDDEDYDRIDKIVYGFLDKLEDFVRPLNRLSYRRRRKIKVHIDGYDVWNADNTIALILHPLLLKLKEQKQGSPCVDDDDVPDNLKSTAALTPKEHEWDVDDNHHLRWEWVLNEMIWAFEQCALPDRGEDKFYHNSGQLEMKFVPLEDNPKLSTVEFNHQKDPNKPAYWVDELGKKEHFDRIQNGIRLFAKYYFGLWD